MIALLFAPSANDEAMTRFDWSVVEATDDAVPRASDSGYPSIESIIGLIVAILLTKET